MNHVAPCPPTVLVMHPDPLLRAGLVAALHQEAGFEVFVDGVADRVADRPRIKAIITDYDNAMRLTGAVRCADDPLATARVLVLTANEREADIRRAIEVGVHGYILQGCPMAELIEGVATVARGLRYVSRGAAQRMADSLTRTSLTLRELDVLSLLVTGESNKSIARKLRIEAGTVKSHMMAIMNKLGAASRTQAAGIATTRGLVERRTLPEPLIRGRGAALASRAQPARATAGP